MKAGEICLPQGHHSAVLSNQLCGPFQPSLQNEKAELQGLVDHWTSWWAASVTLTKWLCCRSFNGVWPSGWRSLMCNQGKSLWNIGIGAWLSNFYVYSSNSTIYWTNSICQWVSDTDTVKPLPYRCIANCMMYFVCIPSYYTWQRGSFGGALGPHATHPLKSPTNLSQMSIMPIAGLLLIQSDSMQIRSQLTISIFGAEDKFLLEAKQLRDTCWKAIPSS